MQVLAAQVVGRSNWRKTPVGVVAISRGLSEAISPVQDGSYDIAEPEGFAAMRRCDPSWVEKAPSDRYPVVSSLIAPQSPANGWHPFGMIDSRTAAPTATTVSTDRQTGFG
jgi:hypothetical protein